MHTLNLNRTQRKLAKELQQEIDNALLTSPGVRRSLQRLFAFDPHCNLSRYRLTPDLKSLAARILNARTRG